MVRRMIRANKCLLRVWKSDEPQNMEVWQRELGILHIEKTEVQDIWELAEMSLCMENS